MAESVTVPFATFVESQLNVYGAVVLLATIVPLISRSTLLTPTLSFALAATETIPFKMLPAEGDAMLTVGGWVSFPGRL